MGGSTGALLSGILQGYAQGSRENEQLTIENDYKKAMISKVKNDLDIEQMKLGAMRRLQADPTDIAAQQMLGIRVDPLDQLIMNRIRTGGAGNTAPTANTELPAVPGFSQFFGGTEQAAPTPVQSMGDIALSGARDELDQLFGPDWMGKAIRHKYYGETNANPNDTVREVQTYDPQGNPVSVPRVRGGGLLWNQAVPSHVKEEWGPSPYPGIDYAFRGSNVVIDPVTNQPKFRQYPIKGERVTTTGPGGEQTSTLVSPFMSGGTPQTPGPQAPSTPPNGKLALTLDTTQPGWQKQAHAAIDQFGTAPKAAAPAGNGPQGIQLAPPKSARVIPAEDMQYWVSSKDLSALNTDMSEKDARAAGYVRVDTTTKSNILAGRQALGVLNDVGPLLQSAFGPENEAAKTTGLWARSMGGSKRYYQQLSQSNPDVAQLERLTQGTLAPIVRQMGEKGNLSDTDIKRAGKLFANTWDTPAVAWQSYRELVGIVQRGINNALGKGETIKGPSLNLGKTAASHSRYKILSVQ